VADPAAWRPTPEQLVAARDRTIPDVVAPGLAVLFVGINPGLYSGAVGHHFARPGNRFWNALHGAGFTDRVLSPFEDRELLAYGLGVTNLVRRTTAAADELAAEELRAGARRLERLVRRYRPGVVAALGVTAYRTGFGHPRALIGPQPEDLAGARLWVLPNPSGRTAAYQLPALIEAFAELRRSVVSPPAGAPGGRPGPPRGARRRR
jgi:TDG/mug DNA glycosylase family protein